MQYGSTCFRKLCRFFSKSKSYAMVNNIIPAGALLKRIIGKVLSPEASTSMMHRTVCGLSTTQLCNSAQRLRRLVSLRSIDSLDNPLMILAVINIARLL